MNNPTTLTLTIVKNDDTSYIVATWGADLSGEYIEIIRW